MSIIVFYIVCKHRYPSTKKVSHTFWCETSFLLYGGLFAFTAAFIAAEALRFSRRYEDGIAAVAHPQRGLILCHHEAELQLERRKFTKEEIVEWISKYKYGNINDLDYRKEIIDTFVNSVFVYDDKLVLTYNYKDGSQTLTLQEIESALSSNLTSMCPPNMRT